MASAARRGIERNATACAATHAALRGSRWSSPDGSPGPTRSRRETRRWISASAASFALNPTLHLDAAPPEGGRPARARHHREHGSRDHGCQERRERDRRRHPGVDPGSPLRRRRLQGLLGALNRLPLDARSGFHHQRPDSSCSGVELHVSEIQCALNGLTAEPGSGGDNAEAYNRAFFEAYSDPNLHWARRRVALHDRARRLAAA